MIDKFKVLGQPMMSELRLMTPTSEKWDFAYNVGKRFFEAHYECQSNN